MLIAEYDGERVYPSEFPNQYYDINSCDEDAEAQPSCPVCNDPVNHISRSVNGRTAHFAHCRGSGGGCSGSSVGESDVHDALKSVAVSAVENRIPLTVDWSDTEVKRDAEHSDTQDKREFDGVVEFAESRPEVGEGIVIEVQYENKCKNKQATTKDVYALDEDWTVIWLYEEDFDMSAQEAQEWRLDIDSSITERIKNHLWPSNNPNSLFTADDAPVAEIAECQDIFAERPVHTEFNYIHDEFCETEHTRATFAGEVVDWLATRYKESHEWASLFRAQHSQELIDGAVNEFSALPKRKYTVRFPVEAIAERYLLSNSWPSDFSREEKVDAVERWAERFGFSESDIRQWMIDTPERVQSVCPECFHAHSIDPIHDGEMKRGKTCRNCGEWFTVYDKRGNVSEVAP